MSNQIYSFCECGCIYNLSIYNFVHHELQLRPLPVHLLLFLQNLLMPVEKGFLTDLLKEFINIVVQDTYVELVLLDVFVILITKFDFPTRGHF